MNPKPNDDCCTVAFPMHATVQQTRGKGLKELALNALEPKASHNVSGSDGGDIVASVARVSTGSSVADVAKNDRNPYERMRIRLLTLAAESSANPARISRLLKADLLACMSLSETQLCAYVLLLSDSADRDEGNAPAGHTAPIHCHRCGPVWARPEVAAALPVVHGWPRAIGCPWCFVRKAGGYIPRPSVACEACDHFTSDRINPVAGMGACDAGRGSHWPMKRHVCASHAPSDTSIPS